MTLDQRLRLPAPVFVALLVAVGSALTVAMDVVVLPAGALATSIVGFLLSDVLRRAVRSVGVRVLLLTASAVATALAVGAWEAVLCLLPAHSVLRPELCSEDGTVSASVVFHLSILATSILVFSVGRRNSPEVSS